MMKRFFILTLLVIQIFYAFINAQSLSIPKIFGDHMVLQRDQPINFWGWGEAGKEISITIDGNSIKDNVNEDGTWILVYPSIEVGGPYSVSISDGNSNLILEDVYFGDVWLASGQSNMEWKLSNVNNAEKEIVSANYPLIRLFYVSNRISDVPLEDLDEGEWKYCTPEITKDFSALAYFFGRALHLDKDIPVGLIDATWGGTPAEAWTSREILHTMDDFDRRLNKISSYENFLEDVKENDELNRQRQLSAGKSFNGLELGVINVDYDDATWDDVYLPNPDKPIPQITWFRKTFEVSSIKRNSEFKLNLGRISDGPIIYINGKEIARGEGSKFVSVDVPSKVLKKGKNVLVIRANNDWSNKVSFLGPEADMMIRNVDDTTLISLNGIWKYNNSLEEIFPETVIRYSHYPSVLFNGMINPIIPYRISGAIWYQGESNAGRAYQYRTLFPKMIEDWRVRWGSGYFPFLFVQLANFEFRNTEPVESDWAELREAQLMTLDYPNTGMAVIIDIGEADDIHPRNKQDVGKRLYLAAKKVAYKEDLVFSGPIYKQMQIEGDKIILEFDHVGSGLAIKDDEYLTGFAIAGADKRFFWAKAVIVDNKVIVVSEDVLKPVAVRYGWDKNPDCNLFNIEGLPASPFRTDDW
jgi:sialate O-acetylesterase